MRVLVVMGEVKMAALLRRGLGEAAHVAVVATSGEEGRRDWSRGAYDVIILDVMLPGMNGFAACRSLLPPSTPPPDESDKQSQTSPKPATPRRRHHPAPNTQSNPRPRRRTGPTDYLPHAFTLHPRRPRPPGRRHRPRTRHRLSHRPRLQRHRHRHQR
jgi:CheY-like chemotaxis protein